MRQVRGDRIVHVSKLMRVQAAARAVQEEASGGLDGAAQRWLDREVTALLIEAASCLPDDLLTELALFASPLEHGGRTIDEIRLALRLLVAWTERLLGPFALLAGDEALHRGVLAVELGPAPSSM